MNKLRFQQLLFSADSGNSPFVGGTDGGILLPDIKIAAGSAGRLQFDPLTREISVTALGLNGVTVDTTATSLANFIAASYPTGTEFQEGDVVVLTTATGGAQTFIQNGGTSGTASDWTLIESPNLSDAYIRSLLSSTTTPALTYNPATGEFSLVVDPGSQNLLQLTAGGLLVDDTRIDNLETLSGVAGATDNGTFTGTTIPDNVSTKAALQAIETAIEATTYTNGLTKTGTDVELGGTLEHATSIVQNGFGLDITNVLLSGATTAISSGENSLFGADGIAETYQNATHRAADFVGDASAWGLSATTIMNAVTDLTNTVTASTTITPAKISSDVKNGGGKRVVFNMDVSGALGEGRFLATDNLVMETGLPSVADIRYGFSAWSPYSIDGNSSADHYVYDPVLGLDISLFQTKIGQLFGSQKYNIVDNQNYSQNGFTIFNNESTYFHGGQTVAGVSSATANHFMRLYNGGIELKTNAGIIDVNSEVVLEDSYLPNNPASYTVLVRDTATGKMSEVTTTIAGVANHEESQHTGATTATFTVSAMSSGWTTPSGYNLAVYKNGQRLAFDAGLSGTNTYRVNSATQVEIDSRLTTDIIVLEYKKA